MALTHIEKKAGRVMLLLLDVDGVMTDGRIIIDSRGVEVKCFHVRDGHGIVMLGRAGVKVGILSGRESEVVRIRARELGIELVRQKALDKLREYDAILGEEGLKDHQVAYLADDIVDLPILRRVGFSIAVPDAVEEVKREADYITTKGGGQGAVREVAELILKARGSWDEVTARYYRE